ncbi:MAG: hypothetical protein HOV81_17355 [Kofleriaceae bacterium]|nr:hypothetical protein [Kofleriaceae bacterium]
MSRLVGLVVLVAACGGEAAPEGPDAGAGVDAALPGPPTAAELLARIANCDQVVGGPFSLDSSGPATVSICGLPNAVFWKAELDVDCDGKMSSKCSLSTDPAYQDQTAATDSLGDPLDAAALPYVVVPGKSTRFDYRAAGLAMGSVFAVIYKDQVQYGVAGDVGPTAIIGEASYRMAELLGIDPDPRTGGTDDEVAYIGFTGMAAIVDPIEDHDRAVSLGEGLATALLAH